jgi:tetratricopeptide (TPR) repeat protein
MSTSCPRSSGSSGAIPGRALLLLAALATAAGPAAGAQGGAPAPAGPAAPPWYEQYRKAVADAELENWEGVVAKIELALKTNARSERNVRTYGMWHASYIPYYYLGLAQYHLGRRADSLKNLEREEAAGVVQHDPVAFLKLNKIAAAIRSGAGGGAAAPGPGAGPSAPAPPGSGPAGKPSSQSADALVQGLQAFFQGDYDSSIAAFQEEMKRSAREDLTLHLYLGMAYAGKAADDGPQRPLWRNLAVLEFKQVHALDPNYALASGVFSEDMVQLFGEARRSR